MRSEERHELKTNELSRFATQAGAFFETYGNQILLAVVAIILIAAAVVYWTRSSTASSAAGWTEFAAAGTAEDFAAIADKYAGEPVGAAARLSEAERHLQAGIRLSFTDRSGAVDELEQAAKSFELALENQALPADMRPQALFGLAQTREALAGKDTAPAVEVYEKLVQDYPDSLFVPEAQRRIEALQSASTQEFYAWFQQQQPKPSDIQRPADGLPAGHPPMGGAGMSLPGIPEQLQLNESPADDENAAPAEAERPQETAASSEPQ